MSKGKYYPVFGRKLASYLMKRGYIVDHTDRNKNNPKWKVFYFFETDSLRKAVENYIWEVRNG